MASSGFEMTMTMASGALSRTPSATCFMIFKFVASRSSRDIPGLRASPAVMITRSDPAMSL
jgi:hypothetical protein